MAGEDGSTLRQHLTQAGKDVEEPAPMGAGYLLDWFWRLSNRRGVGMGQEPISWEAIDAWAHRAGEQPEPWEVRMIEVLDNAFMAEVGKRGLAK